MEPSGLPVPTVKTAHINYLDVMLEVPEFLTELWPYEMALNEWPTFCGPDEGLGDLLVPDVVCGVVISPACFIHDIDWAICRKTYLDFQLSNSRLLHNMNELISKHVQNRHDYEKAIRISFAYWEAVSSPIGWANFSPCGTDPWSNPTVKKRLQRLAKAKFKIN